MRRVDRDPAPHIDVRSYVAGDGTDETADLQAAVTAVAGGRLFIPPSVTIQISAPITLSSSTTIFGGGTIKQRTTNAVTTFPQALLYANAKTGVVIDGITLDGNYTASNAGAMVRGIYFVTVTNSVVRNCVVTGVETTGVYLADACTGNQVIDNRIAGRSGLGGSDSAPLIYVVSTIYGTNGTNGLKDEDGTVDFSHADAIAATTVKNVVRGNTCTYGTHGVLLFNADNNVVSGNVCDTNAHRGILLGPTSANNAITGNTILSAASTGIHLVWGSYHNAISGNTIDGVTGGEGDGIKGYYDVKYNVIAGNTVLGAYKSGIRLVVNAQNNVVVGNHCFGCGTSPSEGAGVLLGGYLDPAGGYTTPTGTFETKNNVVANNVLTNCYRGVELSDFGQTGTTVQYNRIAGNTATGCTVGFKSSATNLVLDNLRGLNHAISNTTNYDDGGNSYRYQDVLNSVAGGQYPTLTGFKLAATSQVTGRVVTNGTAAPVSGTWNQGDIVYNTAPSAGGTVGWVCTTGGSPGTWKTFGSIAA